MLDLEKLLAPVTPVQPGGVDLEYDPAFIALFETARGKPEQRMGSSVIPAEPPDWRSVADAATALFARTKDLRVAIVLVKAMLHTAGVAGLFDGLAFIRALLERHWDTVHPQLDADDGDDPAMRMNALADLADPDTVLSAFRNAELASARGVGRIRVRDLEKRDVAAAGAEDGNGEAHSVDVVFSASDRVALAKTAEAAAAAVADLRAIEELVRDKVGAERAPNLSRLVALLHLVAKTLSGRVARDGVGTEDQPAGEGERSTSPTSPDVPGTAPFGGTIRSRNDVLLALDGICAYYERFEPSSPIPLLLKRSKRLVAMSFLDIVRDLVPEAIAQVEVFGGKQNPDSSSGGETT